MISALYISYDGMTDPLGRSQVLPYLRGLSKKGVSYTLISFEKKDKYLVYGHTVHQICKEASITWVPLRFTSKPLIISKFRDYLKMMSTARHLHQKTNFQITHCRSYIAAFVGLSLKKKYNVKFLFDMRGFWVDERVDGNIWNLKNPLFKFIYRYFKKKEREFLATADAIIAVTHAGKKEMLKWAVPNLSEKKISVIPGAADFDHFSLVNQANKKEARKLLNISDEDFVLSYIGSIGTWYLLDDMVRFFSLLNKKIPNSKFLILTPEPREHILNVIKRHKVSEQDVMIKYVQREVLPDYAHAADWNIFFIKPAYSKIGASPVKLGEILAMGIPIICNKIGDVEDVITKTDSGVCLSDLSESTFENVIKNLDARQFNAVEIREKGKLFFDLTTGIESFWTIYKNIVPVTSYSKPKTIA